MSIKIVLADHHEMVREGIKGLLEKEPGLAVIGETCHGHESVRLVGQLSPDIIMIDLYLPHLNGIEATKQICASGSKCRIIGLSSCNDQRAINQILAAGAAAYVSKRRPFHELLQTIHLVHGKQQCRRPTIRRAPVAPADILQPNSAKLSERERQTLVLMASGKSSKEIARGLDVSVKTVELYRHNLRTKLGCPSVAELTRYAIQEGLAEAKI